MPDIHDPLSAVRAGFRLQAIDEYAPDAEFVGRFPRAERYLGWPMLVVLVLDARACGVERVLGQSG